MDIIAIQEAKKVKKMVGDTSTLQTQAKDTTVNAINELAISLSLLLPDPPPNLSTKTLLIQGVSCLLSDNVPDNSEGSIPALGSSVIATRSLQPQSNTLISFGSGKSGTLQAELNNIVVGEKILDDTNNTGVYNHLEITRNSDYPIDTPGFYMDLDARFKAISDLLIGYNRVRLIHTETGSTEYTGFVVDDGVGNPIVSNVDALEDTLIPSYSSGIPHYGNGSKLNFLASISNAITKVYGSVLAVVSGNGISNNSYSASDLGVITPEDNQLVLLDKVITLNQDFVGVASFNVSGRHPLASNHNVSINKNILVKIGEGGVNESFRVSTTNTEYPNENPTEPFFDGVNLTSSHEAKIVGGVLKFDKTNYSNSFMPIGPDYSLHLDTQYACFVLPLVAKTNANIVINGSYDKCWIKLPNQTGWLDTSLNYPGAGNPVNDGDACRISGDDNNFSITFGTQSTVNSGNVVALRFRMVVGNSISSISIS